MLQEKIWIVDESKLNQNLIQAMSEGKAVIHDGVAYWAQGSGKTGVIQHLPFKETSFQNVDEALKTAQTTATIAAAVSTGIILAAIVVQTKYLAVKLDKIQSTVNEISQDVHAQNVVYYMDKITDYVGHIETARTLLKDRSLANEITELTLPLLTTLSGKRNQVLSFIDNIIELANSDKDVTPRHFELITHFAQMMLELIPFGIHVEYLLSARIGKLRLAEHILMDGSERFNAALEVFRNFMNALHRKLVLGQIGQRADIYRAIEGRALQLFQSQNNRSLLTLATGRVAVALEAPR